MITVKQLIDLLKEEDQDRRVRRAGVIFNDGDALLVHKEDVRESKKVREKKTKE